MDGAVFTTSVGAHTAQVVALVTQDARGLIATVDMNGPQWPYMGSIRDRIAKVDPSLANPEVGTSAYVPEVAGALVGGVVLVAAFVACELYVRSPMLPMQHFQSRAFSAGNAGGFLP